MFQWDGYCETMMDESGQAVMFWKPASTHCKPKKTQLPCLKKTKRRLSEWA